MINTDSLNLSERQLLDEYSKSPGAILLNQLLDNAVLTAHIVMDDCVEAVDKRHV